MNYFMFGIGACLVILAGAYIFNVIYEVTVRCRDRLWRLQRLRKVPPMELDEYINFVVKLWMSELIRYLRDVV